MRDDTSRFPYGWALEGDVTWDVKCHNVTRPAKMSLEDRVEATRIRKEWGNALFRDHRYQEALDKYEIAYSVSFVCGGPFVRGCVCGCVVWVYAQIRKEWGNALFCDHRYPEALDKI